MITAILATAIPVLYLTIAALSARYVFLAQKAKFSAMEVVSYRWQKLTRWDDSDTQSDWTAISITLGAFWPLTMPFYLAITYPDKAERTLNRAVMRKNALDDSMKLLREANAELDRLGIDAGQR